MATADRAQLTDLLAVAVPLRIIQLQELDDAAFWATWRQWQDDAEAAGVFKENVLYGGKDGERSAAFGAMARAIAALAFVPGGVRLFGRHWRAERGERVGRDA